MITVFLVDDHEVVRRGVADLVDGEADMTVVGQAPSVATTLARVPALRPDVAVLDVRLPDGNGVELCRELRDRLPGLRCLILTSFTDERAMVNAVLAGADGYVIKDIEGLRLIDAIRRVGSGHTLLDERAVTALMTRLRADTAEPGPLAGLTDQERTLLDLLGESLTNRQIADRMFLAEKTVKNYVSRLLAKLGLERRSQAAVLVTEVHDEARRQPN
ncbi:response regulator transcription factor [Amycolatopsis minnesotensis]|uniref:response regulator transcription factor n=1 Tax=Amycolatopsis minnesotensis TaxID=337894 RepID=UPI0031E30D40